MSATVCDLSLFVDLKSIDRSYHTENHQIFQKLPEQVNNCEIHRQLDALGDYYRLRQASHKENQKSKKDTRFNSREGQEW